MGTRLVVPHPEELATPRRTPRTRLLSACISNACGHGYPFSFLYNHCLNFRALNAITFYCHCVFWACEGIAGENGQAPVERQSRSTGKSTIKWSLRDLDCFVVSQSSRFSSLACPGPPPLPILPEISRYFIFPSPSPPLFTSSFPSREKNFRPKGLLPRHPARNCWQAQLPRHLFPLFFPACLTSLST